MQRRMTPITDLTTLQSPADPPQFEPSIAESLNLGSEIGTPQFNPNLNNPVSAAENTEKLSLTEDPNFIDPEETAEEMNIESFAGMLDGLYNSETLPRLSELDVAFEMDEVEIVEEELWDDNDSDLDGDADSGALEDEWEWRVVL